jgi:hypothetical protein
MLPVDPSEVQRRVSKWSSRSARLLTDSRTFSSTRFSDAGNLAAEISAAVRQIRSNACPGSGAKLSADACRFVIFL